MTVCLKLVVVVLMCNLFMRSAVARGDTWKPADGPLMSRWAKDVSPENAHAEYPRPQMAREKWLNLNGLWDLTIDDAKANEKVLVPFPPESALSGVMKGGTKFVYRRTFEVPKDWNGQHVLLNFGAVDWESTVEVNGKKFGPHKGGYDAFSYDITDALKTDGAQEVVVTAIDPTDKGEQPRGKQIENPHGIWYTPTSGIWQTVWIEPVAENYIESIKLTPNVDTSELVVHVNSGGVQDKSPTSEVIVRDGDKEVARGSGMGEVKLKVSDPKLWSPDAPFLYDVSITLKHGDRVSDSIKSYCGFRKIEVKSDGKFNRLFLSGKALFQIGLLDQGFWPDGLYTAPTDDALKYDIEETKRLGFNLIRKHVKVEPARWYYWADKLGVVVWQDMPSANNGVWNHPESEKVSEEVASAAKKQYEVELTQLIQQHLNSPSIVMWVVFNEGWGQYETPRITKLAKDLDPTRLVNNASGWTDFKVGDVIDMHSYPGPGVNSPEANRAAVLGEFGGLGLVVDGHMWTSDHFSYKGMEDANDLTANFKRLMGRVWQLHNEQGLAATVYTQTTDVEKEGNGLLTYDRAVLKMPAEEIQAANRGDIPLVSMKIIVPTSREETQTWRYTFEKPAADWFAEKFDDAAWKSGPGGFGTEGTPNAVVRTVWNTPDIWIRREFDLPDGTAKDLNFLVNHDEACEIYINGVLAAKRRHHSGEYIEQAINKDGQKALRTGKNVIAVHCTQTIGGQYIDVGLVQLLMQKNSSK